MATFPSWECTPGPSDGRRRHGSYHCNTQKQPAPSTSDVHKWVSNRRGRRCRPRPLGAAPTASRAMAVARAAAAIGMAAVVSAVLVRPAAASASASTLFTSEGAAVAPPWIVRGGASGGQGGGSKGASPPPYARNPPRDGVLYDELEVHWGATARDIKKAYYRLAVQHHPDKRPGDSYAEDRFKRVSEAYQILQDDSVREKYHRRGVSALEEDSWGGEGRGDGGGSDGRGGNARGRGTRVDPMEVFRTFLDGGMFEHLIGPLSPRMVPVQDPDYHHQKSKVLAEELERRLEVDVRGNSFWFDRAAWAEALQLREQSMGRQILRTVGYVYKNYAQRTLGKLAPNALQPEAIRGRMRFYSDQAHRANNLLSAVSSATRLYVHLQTRKPEQLSPERGSAQRYSADDEETVTRVMEALWSVHRVDVEHTVQRACKMVLRDPRVPPSGRRKRAEALMRLGGIFTSAAKGKNPEPGTYPFVENASTDPFAASVAATSASASASARAPPSSSPPPYAGYGYSYGYSHSYGYDYGDARVDYVGNNNGIDDGGMGRARGWREEEDEEEEGEEGEEALPGGGAWHSAWATGDGGDTSPWTTTAAAGEPPRCFGVDGGGREKGVGVDVYGGVGDGGDGGEGGDGGRSGSFGTSGGRASEAGSSAHLPRSSDDSSGDAESTRGALFFQEKEEESLRGAGDGWLRPPFYPPPGGGGSSGHDGEGSASWSDVRVGAVEGVSGTSSGGISGGERSSSQIPRGDAGAEGDLAGTRSGVVRGRWGGSSSRLSSTIVMPPPPPPEETQEADDDWRENVR